MEFLVEFDVHVPDGTTEGEVRQFVSAEATAAAGLAREGHLARLWKPPTAPGENKAVGLYRAENEPEVHRLLGALPLNDWMQTTVTPLEPHPNDPARTPASPFQLPDPRLTRVYRLEATLAQPLELGDLAGGHRRIVPLAGGTFRGPEISGSSSRAPAPTGRPSCRTAPPTATFATRSRPTRARSCTSSRAASATVMPKSWRVWLGATMSTLPSTRFAPRRRSRPPCPSSIG